MENGMQNGVNVWQLSINQCEMNVSICKMSLVWAMPLITAISQLTIAKTCTYTCIEVVFQEAVKLLKFWRKIFYILTWTVPILTKINQ